MAYDYRIDRDRCVVYVRMSGPLTLPEIRQLADRLAADPDVTPGIAELIDLREATAEGVSADDLRNIAAATLDSATRRAFVTSDVLTYGLARMFEIYRELNRKPDKVAVFREVAAAETWIAATS